MTDKNVCVTLIMRNQNKILIERLDEKLKVFADAKDVKVPQRGWVYAIRKTLNMTLQQLGNKLGITPQAAKGIEQREVSEAISIKSLREVGRVLDMQLVYGFVPKDSSIEKLVERKARDLAQKIVLRTHHNMRLEDQANSDKRIREAIEELTQELKTELKKSLWN